MSITAAINSAVSGLRAQGAQLSAVSENLANSSTIAYKNREIDFNSLVVGNTTRNGFSGGGVIFRANQAMESQGLLETTDSGTDMGINGSGFFVVSDDIDNQPSGYTYSRNGNFKKDEDGFLVNSEGVYLMGQRTDDTGRVISLAQNDLSSVEPVNVGAVAGTAQATQNVRFDLNLPADDVIFNPLDTAAGGRHNTNVQIFDALGIGHDIPITWVKEGVNQWTATFEEPKQKDTNGLVDTLANPVSAGGTDFVEVGASGSNVLTINFNGDGTIASFVPADTTITIPTFAQGALAPQTINLDMGAIGSSNGVTQFSGSTATPKLETFFVDQDGVRFGQLSNVEINNEGLVEAIFENGVVLPIYQVPIATFQNPYGLSQVNGTIYDEADNAGVMILKQPGQGDAGEIVANSIEMSTTDTASEFNKMIISQQAYSANAQVVSTADELFDELIAAVR